MRSKKRNRSSGAWTAQDHDQRDQRRLAKKQKKQQQEKQTMEPTDQVARSTSEHRTAVLTHETQEKKDAMKLKLHIEHSKRQLQTLHQRLRNWDPQEEAIKYQKALEEAAKAEQEALQSVDEKKRRRRRRKGPETWKLRGAARPAHEVYDFDTRYVDPHIKAHEQAQAKARRSLNLLVMGKGHFGSPTLSSQIPSLVCRPDSSSSVTSETMDVDPSLDLRRDYLSLKMQLGHLSQQAKHFKTARECFLECIDLEGSGADDDNFVTTAREDLMKLYMHLGRHKAALRLGEQLVTKSNFVNTPVWILYSLALVSFLLQKNETGQKEATDEKDDMIRNDCTKRYMQMAIKSNPFCAYYLAFYDTFASVMEYTDDVHDAEEGPQTSFEEAIEYCSSGQAELWCKSEANEVLRTLLVQAKQTKIATNEEALSSEDVGWEEKLSRIEEHYDALDNTKAEEMDGEDGDGHGDAPDSDAALDQLDVRMYAGMFRTAIEMIESAGQI